MEKRHDPGRNSTVVTVFRDPFCRSYRWVAHSGGTTMGKLGIAVGTVLLFCCGALGAAADDSRSWWSVDHDDHRTWTLALSGGVYEQKLSGKVQVDTDFGDAFVDVDILNLDKDTNGWGEVDLQLFQKHHLRLSFVPIKFDGDTVLSQTIEFGGDTFEISDRVSSTLKMNTYELSYRYDIYLGKWLTLSPLIQVSAIDGEVEVRDQTLGLGAKESQWVPVPALGVRAEFYPLARIGVFAEGKGFTIGNPATMWDVQGGVTVHLLRWLALRGSYRVIDYDVDYQGYKVDARIKGPFAGATIRF